MTSVPAESSFLATTRDGIQLSLTRFEQPGSSFPPVLLTHGTFSDGTICRRLAAYLYSQGFDSWIFEWRGHGKSASGSAAVDYEHFATHDIEAAVATVLQETGRPSLLFVGHSAGGVLPWMHLARQRSSAARFRGVVSLASQTTHAGRSLWPKLVLLMTGGITRVLGRAPARLFKLGPNDESSPMMNQWVKWNVSGDWVGADGLRYADALGHVRVPALVLAGGGDRFIAPVAGCRALFDALGSPDRTFIYCSKANGFREDYGHARIIASRNAEAEVWPKIADWLRRVGADDQVPPGAVVA